MNQLIIEQINNGEIPLEKAYKLYGKEEVEKALQEIKASDEQILQQYSPEAMKKQIMAKYNRNVENRARFRASETYRFSKVFGMAAALVLVCGVVFTTYKTNSKTQNPIVRVKGFGGTEERVSKLAIYKKTENGSVLLKSGDFAKAGDLLQVAYDAGSKKYGIIFSIDGNGNVTRHFPENNWTACSLKNEATLLDFAYELDDAPEYENFYFLTSDQSFTISEADAYQVLVDEKFLSKKYKKVSKVEVKINK